MKGEYLIRDANSRISLIWEEGNINRDNIADCISVGMLSLESDLTIKSALLWIIGRL